MDRVTKYSLLTAIPVVALIVVIWRFAPDGPFLGVALFAIGTGSGYAIRRYWKSRLGEQES